MKRRALASPALALVIWVAATMATNAADNEYRLAILSPSAGAVQHIRTTAVAELARHGFVEGRNLVIETRAAPTERLVSAARELVASKPGVVIATGSAAIRALQGADGSTPIVGAFIGEDPIAAGFATSLAHPGGMVTGIVMLAPELDAKRLQILHEVVPDSHRVAALAVDPRREAPNLAAVREVAERTGIEILPFYAAKATDYPAAFLSTKSAGANALEIVSAPELFTDAVRLAALASKAKLPTACEWAQMAHSGCLIGYGSNFAELQQRVADYVAHILRGVPPGELPIEGPTRFEFAVNLKTARELGITIPRAILARADEVIE
jgi:ABC-type uncharacterized transport system substrate-binding protein